MSKLDDLLMELDMFDFRYPYMRERAEQLGISTAEELKKFVDEEERIVNVADNLPYEIRCKGLEERIRVAREYVKNMEKGETH